jgi:quercetin dioxygenase-like cupin family protein
VEVDYAPGAASPSHTHTKLAFICAYVISGAIESKVNDNETRVYRTGLWFQARRALRNFILSKVGRTQT